MQTIIIGGGIGGLTTALALSRQGISTQIYERSPVIRPVGAGIILANNAMQVYRQLGLQERIEAAGCRLHQIQITDRSLRQLSRVSLQPFEEKYGVCNVAIHRGELQKILVDALPEGCLILGQQLESLTSAEPGYRLQFASGLEIGATVVIGADGIHSTVRQGMQQPGTIRDARQICWRGLTDFQLPPEYSGIATEAWGRGDRIGFVQIGKDRTYWYALKNGDVRQNPYTVDELPGLFSDYAPLVREMLAATRPESIHTDGIYDLRPLPLWYKNGICLIGDAAHATTPNMGQGACQAIEDAATLANCLQENDPSTAFARFQQLREKKAGMVVENSWRLGKIAQWSNPVATTIRNTVLRLTPSAVNQRQMDMIFRPVRH